MHKYVIRLLVWGIRNPQASNFPYHLRRDFILGLLGMEDYVSDGEPAVPMPYGLCANCGRVHKVPFHSILAVHPSCMSCDPFFTYKVQWSNLVIAPDCVRFLPTWLQEDIAHYLEELGVDTVLKL